MKKNKALIPHPVLFGLFPILFLYAQNARETALGDIWTPLGITLAAVLAAQAVFSLVFKNREKGALLTTVLVLLFFSYGHLVALLSAFRLELDETIIGPNGVVLAVWLVLFYYAVKAIRRTRRDLRGTTRLLNYIALILFFIQVAQGGLVLLNREKIARIPGERAVADGGKPEKRPDVYFICMDGYGRQDLLKGMYGFDNSDFIAFLKERGFKVADEGYSNYCQTLLSLAATFNLNYIDSIGDFPSAYYDRMPLAEMFWDNEVFRQFKAREYTNVVFSSGYNFTEFETADKYFAPAWSVSGFYNVLLYTTPLPLIFCNEKSPFDSHRKRIEYIFDKLPEIYEVGSPKFVFAHILSPHPPFVFEENGDAAPPERPFSMEDGSHFMNSGGTVEEYQAGYKKQITYITARLRETVEKILEKNRDNPPVIIIQADHGPGSGLSWVGRDESNLPERFSILNAVYLPETEYLPDTETDVAFERFSPVNTFRLVFNAYFNTAYDLLPHHSYYTTWAHPFDFREITRMLDASIYDARDFVAVPDISYKTINRPKKPGTMYNAPGCRLLGRNGLAISALPAVRSDRLEISVDHNDGYVFYFRRDTAMTGFVNVAVKWQKDGGLRLDSLVVPERARNEGYDNILVVPYGGDGRSSLGHLRFLESNR